MNLFGSQTNNRVEGWHTRLKKVVGKAHSNLFEIIDVMKKEQASSEIKLQQLEMGGQVCFLGDSRMGNIVLVTI